MTSTLTVITAKKEGLFSQIQAIFDLTQRTSDKTISQKLLVKYNSVARLRQQFSDALDKFNELSLEADAQFKPNYAALSAVDDLVNHITYTVAQIGAKQKPKTDTNSTPTPQPCSLRLPKLELKHFSGDPVEWISFLNLFNSAIHNNASLNAVTKLQYLITLVSAEPLSLIKSLPISEANYQVAYDLLKERYHSPRLLTSLHLNKILDLPSVNHTARQIRTFITCYAENTQALKGLQTDITNNNPLLAAMLLRKLDSTLLKKFEHSRSDQPSSLPGPEEIIKFLMQECNEIEQASLYSTSNTKLQTSDSNHSHANKPGKHLATKKSYFEERKVSLVTSNSNDDRPSSSASWKHSSCFYCKKLDHTIYSCQNFKAKDPQTRYQITKDNKRCTSCLGAHLTSECKSQALCFTCNKRHHSLLHFDNKKISQSNVRPHEVGLPHQLNGPENKSPAVSLTSQSNDYVSQNNSASQNTTVLLGTLLVKLTAPNGMTHVFRALADSGSQSSFITEQVANLLCISRSQSHHNIVGLSQTLTRSKGMASLDVQTLSGMVIAANHDFLILDKICMDLPRTRIASNVLNLVRPYVLADPTCNYPGKIDVLLGGALFPLMLTQAIHSLGANLPHLIGSHFGFLVMGKAPCMSQGNSEISSNLSTTLLTMNDMELHDSVQKFWKQEELPVINKLSKNDQLCEEHFIATHSRSDSGRYCVRLPFKPGMPPLGTSRAVAENRLKSLERKFSVQPHFKQLYSDFMSDYANSGHMEIVQEIDLQSQHYFLPHHGVLQDSSSICLRTVFDASSKSSNGS